MPRLANQRPPPAQEIQLNHYSTHISRRNIFSRYRIFFSGINILFYLTVLIGRFPEKSIAPGGGSVVLQFQKNNQKPSVMLPSFGRHVFPPDHGQYAR